MVDEMLTRRGFVPALPAASSLAAQALSDRPEVPAAGRFVRRWWYEPGVEHGNMATNSRFRVNAPEVVLHPTFAVRPEVRSSGMMQIRVEEDLRAIEGVELSLEIWGGHPGTLHKRVTPNGRTTYWFPETGTAAGHCTHQYPVFRLKVTDLAPGYNALQFACDQGPSFWGHFIVEQACIRTIVPAGHADIRKLGLEGFSAAVIAEPRSGEDRVEVSLRLSDPGRVARVEYQGYYEGYDENGNGESKDWHGFTKARAPVGFLGAADQPPFRCQWDTSMLAAQKDMAVRATLHLKDAANLTFETAPATGVAMPSGRTAAVKVFPTAQKPAPFWSRANNLKRATIPVDIDPARVERAELHTVSWDGGSGNVKEYFKLNGRHMEIAGRGRHDVLYTVLPVAPGGLRKGVNEIELLSGTEHHGIEILEPGPALVVRYR
jgi:hypothetical protein